MHERVVVRGRKCRLRHWSCVLREWIGVDLRSVRMLYYRIFLKRGSSPKWTTFHNFAESQITIRIQAPRQIIKPTILRLTLPHRTTKCPQARSNSLRNPRKIMGKRPATSNRRLHMPRKHDVQHNSCQLSQTVLPNQYQPRDSRENIITA